VTVDGFKSTAFRSRTLRLRISQFTNRQCRYPQTDMTTTVQSTFSSSGEDAISRSIDVTSHSSAQRPASSGIADFYEIERTAKQIKDGAFKRVSVSISQAVVTLWIAHANLTFC